MAAFNKFEDFSEQLTRGVHLWASHVFKVALTNSAPIASNTILANITQIAGTNGYTTGGATTTIGVSETAGVTTVTGTEVTFTSTGTMGPFRYAVLYNDTATSPNDALVGWWDYGSALTLNNTETFNARFNNAATGTIFTLT